MVASTTEKGAPAGAAEASLSCLGRSPREEEQKSKKEKRLMAPKLASEACPLPGEGGSRPGPLFAFLLTAAGRGG